MTYGDMIEKIMPEVEKGGDEPFLIYRDADGGSHPTNASVGGDPGWHGDFTKNQYGETFDWVADAISADSAAFVARGLDFAGGGYPYVFNKTLCQRMGNEYHNVTSYDMGAEHKKIYALLNFFEDNVSEFSQETLDYLIDVDRPLKALTGLCPFNMATGHEGWTFNEDLAPDAVDAIERRIETLLERRKTELIDSPQEVKPANAKRVIDGYTEKFSVALAGREVFLAVDETQDAPYLVCTAKWDNPLGVTEYADGAVTCDFLEAMRDFVDRADTLLCSLEQERAAFPTIQPTLTAADCVPSGLDADLMGKVVIIKSEVLSPEYRFADHQLKIVTGGFGSYPDARGNAVFCKDLYSDRESRFERYDIAGVADTNRIPEWANRKLAYLEALKEPGVFEYGGYHFKPLRQFEKRDGGFSDQMRRVSSDRQLGISTYAWKKTDYSYDAFYSASGYSQADVFRCLENGRLYVPCDGELFQYTEPPAKEQAKSAPTQAKKPAERAPDESQKPKSILGDLDAATAEAAECNAARQVGDKPKKRGELEVD